jgi:hypothetical protein
MTSISRAALARLELEALISPSVPSFDFNFASK